MKKIHKTKAVYIINPYISHPVTYGSMNLPPVIGSKTTIKVEPQTIKATLK